MKTLWQQKGPTEPIIELIGKLGVKGAAGELKVKEEEVLAQVTILRYQYDTEFFAEDRLKITSKSGAVVPLIYNKGQKKINQAIERQRLAAKPVRVALLKARQFGGSTLFEAELFKEGMLRQNRHSMIIAHDLDSARHLRDMSTRFWDNYDLAKPRLRKETDKWWKFLHWTGGRPVNSHLRIDTAEELSTGHSFTLHNLHLSEVQAWRNATVLVKGLFPTVPNYPDTMIFMEGTGSGVGDFWYDFCQVAQDASSEWEFVFVPWYEIEDYTLTFPSEEVKSEFQGRMDGEERLFYHQGVTLEQLYWRRKTINDKYRGDVDGFRQQYPSTADEAFLTSGRPVFSMLRVKEELAKTAQKVRLGNLEWRRASDTFKKSVVFVEDRKGVWSLKEDPVPKGRYLYCSGADVAEGIAVIPEFGNRGGDKSAARIFRRDKRTFVATINCHLDPDVFAEELEKASYYWSCLSGPLPLLVENNPGGSGNVVIRDLKGQSGVNLLKTVTLDRAKDVRKEEYGWDTNRESKREMIDELVEQIREARFSDFDRESWAQAATYVRDEKGKTNAQSRKFDDLVIATALSLQADKMLPAASIPTDAPVRVITRDMDIPENRSKKVGRVTQEEVMELNYAAF